MLFKRAYGHRDISFGRYINPIENRGIDYAFLHRPCIFQQHLIICSIYYEDSLTYNNAVSFLILSYILTYELQSITIMTVPISRWHFAWPSQK